MAKAWKRQKRQKGSQADEETVTFFKLIHETKRNVTLPLFEDCLAVISICSTLSIFIMWMETLILIFFASFLEIQSKSVINLDGNLTNDKSKCLL